MVHARAQASASARGTAQARPAGYTRFSRILEVLLGLDLVLSNIQLDFGIGSH